MEEEEGMEKEEEEKQGEEKKTEVAEEEQEGSREDRGYVFRLYLSESSSETES